MGTFTATIGNQERTYAFKPKYQDPKDKPSLKSWGHRTVDFCDSANNRLGVFKLASSMGRFVPEAAEMMGKTAPAEIAKVGKLMTTIYTHTCTFRTPGAVKSLFDEGAAHKNTLTTKTDGKGGPAESSASKARYTAGKVAVATMSVFYTVSLVGGYMGGRMDVVVSQALNIATVADDANDYISVVNSFSEYREIFQLAEFLKAEGNNIQGLEEEVLEEAKQAVKEAQDRSRNALIADICSVSATTLAIAGTMTTSGPMSKMAFIRKLSFLPAGGKASSFAIVTLKLVNASIGTLDKIKEEGRDTKMDLRLVGRKEPSSKNPGAAPL